MGLEEVLGDSLGLNFSHVGTGLYNQWVPGHTSHLQLFGVCLSIPSPTSMTLAHSFYCRKDMTNVRRDEQSLSEFCLLRCCSSFHTMVTTWMHRETTQHCMCPSNSSTVSHCLPQNIFIPNSWPCCPAKSVSKSCPPPLWRRGGLQTVRQDADTPLPAKNPVQPPKPNSKENSKGSMACRISRPHPNPDPLRVGLGLNQRSVERSLCQPMAELPAVCSILY